MNYRWLPRRGTSKARIPEDSWGPAVCELPVDLGGKGVYSSCTPILLTEPADPMPRPIQSDYAVRNDNVAGRPFWIRSRGRCRPLSSAAFPFTALLALVLLVLPACTSLGPDKVLRDRSDYSDALAESWMRQYLLNIVKMRYYSPPFFVDVGSIVSGYTLETQATGELLLVRRGSDALGLLGGRRFTDRPTTTYTPVSGDAFMARYMTPLAPDALFSLIEMGMSADVILLTSISGWNGLRNRRFAVEGGTEGDERFFRSVELFRLIQAADGVDVRVLSEEEADAPPATLVILQARHVPEEIQDHIREFQELMDLDPAIEEYRLVFGMVPERPDEIAVQTRSVLQMMSMLAAGISVPEHHMADGRAAADIEYRNFRILQVQSDARQPELALVAVQYRGYWFWIDDRDIESKRMFSMLMRIFSFADTTEPITMPLLIHAQ